MPNTVGPVNDDRNPYLIRHRHPIGDRFVIVSRGVLFGYPNLSDGAKLTYWVIYSHDWYLPQGRKGYVWPTVGRIARLRHTTGRTIQRHLNELIACGLVTRELRKGQPSILYLEEPEDKRGGDGNVGGGVTEMSPPSEEDELKQRNNAVKRSEADRQPQSGWRSLGSLLPGNRSKSGSDNQKDYIAQRILEATGDAHSLNCYRLLARRCAPQLLMEALSLLKEARSNGQVKRSRGALYLGIVRRLCAERGQPDPLARSASSSSPSKATLP